MSPGQRESPGDDSQAPSRSFGGDTPKAREMPAVVDGSPARVVFDTEPAVDLVSIGRAELNVWEDGFRVGYVQGVEKGRKDAADEAATLHRAAVEIVRTMASIDPHEERWARVVGQ